MDTAEHANGRYRHHALLYDSDVSFVDAVVPFVQEGVDAGEPVLLGLTEAKVGLLARHHDLGHELVLIQDLEYANPVKTIHRWLSEFGALVGGGAPGIRALGEVPHPGTGGDWYQWVRYEAIINRAFADVALWSLCPYDERVTPPEVLADVACTHPFLTTVDGHRPSAWYEDEAAFLERLPRRPGLGDVRPPDRVFHDPMPHEARHHLIGLTDGMGLDPDAVDDLHVAVSELVSNARHHGDDPVTVRVWTEPDRLEVTVTDRGAGPADPCVGWIPPADPAAIGGGRGLWLTHQLALTLDVWREADEGFTARLSIVA
ncbi:MAG: anti-sigma factor RsbA family regulatory protein [Acidimicrobiales bacterium]